MTGEREMS